MIEKAVAVLRDGGVLVFPTETFYGLGADPENAVAMERLYRLKGRDFGKAVSIVVSSSSMVDSRVMRVSPEARQLMDRFWPGPLTLLFPQRKGRCELASRDTGKLGIRVPDHPVALAVLEAWGGAITATSANRSGEASPVLIGDAEKAFGAGVDLYLDAGPTRGVRESTIVDTTRDPPRLVREGVIPYSEVMEVLGYGLTEPHDW